MSALGEALRSLARVLDERGLDWFVFGAQAVRAPIKIISSPGAELGHEGEARGGSVPGVLDRRATKPSWVSAVLGGEIILIGALTVRGAPRATQDLDVTVWVDRPQLPDLLKALESEGLRHRYPEIADELLASGSVLPLSHPGGMTFAACSRAAMSTWTKFVTCLASSRTHWDNLISCRSSRVRCARLATDEVVFGGATSGFVDGLFFDRVIFTP
jgi:hypothetical protein